GSADQINSDPRVLEWLRKEYGIDVEECEGVAVAQVASMHGKPFVVIRGISDNELINPAYGEYLRTGKGDLGWVEVESTRNAWIVFLDMVQRLADNFR
ncbi:MAG TPA: 5'-methylthioadenosine/S-adenosylhomocysteine nucleosidase, partial [Firmicutes bacterium]|nr:5'-methylthioadenosine/S-adenosylhomocysteine nucleosidase [Candidatus Fermentithermobacillaceae bacterium]